MTDAEINKKTASEGKSMFTIFLLSRGVYNLKKKNLVEYNKIALDITEDSYLHEWMEFDKMYVFQQEDLKKEAKSVTRPFSFIFPIDQAKKMLLVDGNKFLIKFLFPESTIVLSFVNIIECWKFYYYGRILYYNIKEFFKSLNHKIDINMRILLDEYRQNSIGTVIAAIINANNTTQNRLLAERTKKFIEEDQVNFIALSHLFQRILIGFYCMEDPPSNFPKLKIFTEQFHRYYFQFIQDLFSNPYTDVG